MQQKPLPPFSCIHTPNLPELLLQLRCTILISTYQAGKVICISAKDDKRLVQLARNFNGVMGMALQDNRMALATKDEVIVLVDDPRLAPEYPKKPNTYDAFYLPRMTYYTGSVNMHDLNWVNNELIGVNTSFSCLVKVSPQYNWEPIWRPSFITELVSEDRCHLNGLVVVDGHPRYVTALGNGNSFQSWRNKLPYGGVLIDTSKNEILLEDLPMPHSPRMIDQKLYVLLSATGELVEVNLDTGSYNVVKSFGGFVRGMAQFGEYLFIGTSKLRENSSTFRHLDISKLANKAAVMIFHLPTRSIVAELEYKNSVDEIYDIQILPNRIRPGILNTMTNIHKHALSIPEATFWARAINE